MTVGVVLYVLAVSALVGGGAAAAEAALRSVRRQARWAWLSAGVISVAVPIFVLWSPDPGARVPAGAATSEGAATIVEVADGALPANAAGPSSTLRDGDGEDAVWGGIPVALHSALETPVPGAAEIWIALSGLALMAGLAAALRLRLRARAWSVGEVAGRSVLLSQDFGPAVVGLPRGRIVVPTWLDEMDPTERELALKHEEEHLRAGDLPLLAAFGALVVLTPWNPVVWWQGRRLARAVELDCDLRLIGGDGSAADYGRALLSVAMMAPRTPGLVAALDGSLLERRVRQLVGEGVSTRRAITAAVAAVVALSLACEMPTPPRAAGTDTAGAFGHLEGPAATAYVRARVGDWGELGRLTREIAHDPRTRSSLGGVALAVRIGEDGRRRLRVEATGGPVVTAGTVDAALRVAEALDLTDLDEDGPPTGWVPVWVLFLEEQVEAHLVLPKLYAEKGWPDDRESLERHLVVVRRLLDPADRGAYSSSMGAADRPGVEEEPVAASSGLLPSPGFSFDLGDVATGEGM